MPQSPHPHHCRANRCRTAWILVFALGAATLPLVGCGGSSTPTGGGQSTASTSKAPSSSAPSAQNSVTSSPVIRIETSAGSIDVLLDPVHAPTTVENFLSYVADGFYDNTVIHYVVPGEMVLAGGYTANYEPKAPTAGPIRNEALNGRKNLRGTIAMTRGASDADSATTQFFINLQDAPQRDHRGEAPEDYGYCVFGEVVDGMEVVEAISNSRATDRGGDLAQSPVEPIVIDSIRVL